MRILAKRSRTRLCCRVTYLLTDTLPASLALDLLLDDIIICGPAIYAGYDEER